MCCFSYSSASRPRGSTVISESRASRCGGPGELAGRVAAAGRCTQLGCGRCGGSRARWGCQCSRAQDQGASAICGDEALELVEPVAHTVICASGTELSSVWAPSLIIKNRWSVRGHVLRPRVPRPPNSLIRRHEWHTNCSFRHVTGAGCGNRGGPHPHAVAWTRYASRWHQRWLQAVVAFR